MLILSESLIRIRDGRVSVEGRLCRHTERITGFLLDLGIARGTIRRRFGRLVFSSGIPEDQRQQIRNFLVNECPLRE